MDIKKLHKLLKDISERRINISKALNILKHLPFEDIKRAKIDHHRSLRKGFPEVILCEGKSKKDIINIYKALLKKNNNILATRASLDIFKALKKIEPKTKYNKDARIIYLERKPANKIKQKILIISAGTADIPVAEEARITAEFLGNTVETIYDVGIAGVHRLLKFNKNISSANALIVVAGMEGALPSFVGGLVEKPIIAVPTSIGYGSCFEGLSALLGMLNSCATGISVVNIDNGFGAGVMASLINHMNIQSTERRE